MKIAYVSSKAYCWDSYSVQRLTFEELQKRCEVKWFDTIDSALEWPCEMIFLMGSNIIPTPEQNKKAKFISFAMSDPPCFKQEKFERCTVYSTNNLELFRKLAPIKPVIHYDTSCDPKYHKCLDIKKETDVLVLGMGEHPYDRNRVETVGRLRKNLPEINGEKIQIKCFGHKWPAHKDNHPFISGENLTREINKAHLFLDLTNEKAAHGRKILESSCCGTPVLTQAKEDVMNWFEGGEEILFYSDYEHMKQLICEYLPQTHKLRTIGMNARKRCLENHTINHRITKLLEDVRKLQN